MKKNNRYYTIALPIIIVLAILVAYQYGYLAVKAEMTSLKEREVTRMGTLQRYVNLIADRPSIEKRLEALREKRTTEMTQIIDAQTMSIAAAALQDVVKTSITTRGDR